MKNPKMLFKSPGPHNWEGMAHYWMVCEASDTAKYLADGWHNTIFDAVAAVKPAEKQVTRADMEIQAVYLGIKVDGRWSDKRLLDEIAKAGQ
jgi:hypothetical protein